MIAVAKLKKDFQQFNQQLSALNDDRYSLSRDDNANLIINFPYKNKIVQLPYVPFRDYQLEVQDALFVKGYRKFFLVWPRRHGKDYTCWQLLLEAAIETPGYYLMIYPTVKSAKRVFWNGNIIMPDGTAIKFVKMIPPGVLAAPPNKTDLLIELTNGSIIQAVGSNHDPDSLRGSNPRGAIFSEYAYQKPDIYQNLAPVFDQNKGWIILETTFNGHNFAYNHFQAVKDMSSWFARCESVDTLLDANGQPYISQEFIEERRRENIPEYKIQQEYYSNVEENTDTMYYGLALKMMRLQGRIKPDLVEPNSYCWVAYDIGRRDPTSIGIFQLNNDKPVCVAYTEYNKRNMQIGIVFIQEFCNKHNLIVKEIILPHDGRNKSAATDLNYSDYLIGYGYRVSTVNSPANKLLAIEACNQLLYKLSIDESCDAFINCLANYEKEYDEKRDEYKPTPVHNWASHGADMFQTFMLAYNKGLIKIKNINQAPHHYDTTGNYG